MITRSYSYLSCAVSISIVWVASPAYDCGTSSRDDSKTVVTVAPSPLSPSILFFEPPEVWNPIFPDFDASADLIIVVLSSCNSNIDNLNYQRFKEGSNQYEYLTSSLSTALPLLTFFLLIVRFLNDIAPVQLVKHQRDESRATPEQSRSVEGW